LSEVPPVHREIYVDSDPETAFDVFTAGIGRWWPLPGHSVYGEGGTVEFSGGVIVERSADGTEAVWGEITRWDPPSGLGFTWHPGRGSESAGHVEVTFTARQSRTLVALTHAGWEVYDDPEAARDEYDKGWPTVLERFRGGVPALAEEDEVTWAALMHTPGPEAPTDVSLFADPRFGQHVAFLTRMHEAGYLVAAGPLVDADGEGMTVLRVPGADRIDFVTRLATKGDVSVAEGFFDVTVRPWRVSLQA
jgi:uncharacterized protein YciI